MHISDSDKKFLKILRVIAMIMLGVMPVIYLIVAYLTSDNPGRFRTEGIDLMAFILLIVATFTPLMAQLIERSQISTFRSRSGSKMKAGNLFFMISIIKLSLAGLCFLLGFLGVMLGMEMTRMLWFYPIAIIWSYIFWPHEKSFEKFLTRVEKQ